MLIVKSALGNLKMPKMESIISKIFSLFFFLIEFLLLEDSVVSRLSVWKRLRRHLDSSWEILHGRPNGLRSLPRREPEKQPTSWRNFPRGRDTVTQTLKNASEFFISKIKIATKLCGLSENIRDSLYELWEAELGAVRAKNGACCFISLSLIWKHSKSQIYSGKRYEIPVAWYKENTKVTFFKSSTVIGVGVW